MRTHYCRDCGHVATHVRMNAVDGDTALRPGVKLEDRTYFCAACAEDHALTEPLPTEDDLMWDGGADSRWEDDPEPFGYDVTDREDD